MKLSAPPPPPPPPSDGTPGENPPGSPDEQPKPDPAASTPAPAAPKQAEWPAWYSGIDAALVGLVLVFAFAAASFAARNSDVWVHLATGKRLFAGQYFPGGSDPFSYGAEGRTWVNHNWLTDAVAYLLYGGTGKVLVGAKALVVALAFGALIAIRRGRFALWPWAACACVAVLAAIPQATLRPLVVSMLLLAVTLYLLFRMPQKKDSWRFPGAIGVTFWLWANCDQWFFIGPLALALLILGDLIQKYGFNSPDEPEGDPDAEPLGRLPDTATLAKALGIGVLACTLTPHHVRVWELPFELVGAPGIEADPRLRLFMLAPHDNVYLNNASLGYNLNGLAYVVLFVTGAVLLGFGGKRVRIAHVALWLGFAVLSLLSVYAIPFFALVSVPLIASLLNALSARVELKTRADPRTRLLLVGSSGGRVLSVLAVCLLCALAYPGWVHPDTPNAAFTRRVAWAVEPDPAAVEAAEQFQRWHDAEALPDDARGMVTNTDLANYLAWYAPKAKVFVNARFQHHRRELADYVTVRKGLGLILVKDDPPNPRDATDVLARRSVEYVALHTGAGDSLNLRLWTQIATQLLYQRWGEWSVWNLDGRTTVFGWRAGPAGGRPSFAALRLDPVAKAFGPGVKKVPDPVLQQPLAPPENDTQQLLEAFMRPVRPAPPGAAECVAWLDYKNGLIARYQVRQQLSAVLFLGGFSDQPNPPSLHHLATRFVDWNGALAFPPRHADSVPEEVAARAVPLLAVRAARRGIADDPDHPDAYYALALALRDPDLPLTESERALGRVIALRQCLSRIPRPDLYRRGQFAVFGTQVARELAGAYLWRRDTWRNPNTKKEVSAHTGFPADIAGLGDLLGHTILIDPQGQRVRIPTARMGEIRLQRGVQVYANGTPHILPLDLARKALELALKYANVDTAGEGAESAQALKKEVETQLKGLEDEEVRNREQYERGKGQAKLPELVDRAVLNCMLGEALDLLRHKDTDLEKEFGPDTFAAAVRRVGLELATGYVEDAADNLAILSAPDMAAALERARGGALQRLNQGGIGGNERYILIERAQAPVRVQQFKYQKALHAGEYRAAGETAAILESRSPGLEPLLAELAKAKVDPNKALLAELGRMPPPVPGGGLLPSLLAARSLLDYYGEVLTTREVIANKMRQDADFFYRRGVLALFSADIPAAKDWFKQARRDSPPGWRLTAIMPEKALMYLQLIERAGR